MTDHLAIAGDVAPAPDRPSALKVVTFGCRLNAVESDAILAQAVADGVTNAVIFNTCAVTGEAVRQARQAIRKAHREQPRARLIVTGCAAQIDPDSFALMPEVARVVGNAQKTMPGALIDSGPRVRVMDIMALRSAAGALNPGTQKRARAYVEVQNGCDHRCTFCIIPFGRGNSRSTSIDQVVTRVRTLADAGYAEVVLTGVDLTSWGADLPTTPTLGRLVRHILAEVPHLARLRLSSIDTAEIDDDLMTALAEERRLAPHLHLSLQSGDDLILKRMKRRHSVADALSLIRAVRIVRPETAIGADLIAGFPTETDTAFNNTLRLVETAQLSFLHVFPYSPRPGTPAARMPRVAPATVKARATALREAGEAALIRHLDRRLGTPVQALVERPGLARAEDFTEVTFHGQATMGALIIGVVADHNGRQARLETWRADPGSRR